MAFHVWQSQLKTLGFLGPDSEEGPLEPNSSQRVEFFDVGRKPIEKIGSTAFFIRRICVPTDVSFSCCHKRLEQRCRSGIYTSKDQ